MAVKIIGKQRGTFEKDGKRYNYATIALASEYSAPTANFEGEGVKVELAKLADPELYYSAEVGDVVEVYYDRYQKVSYIRVVE